MNKPYILTSEKSKKNYNLIIIYITFKLNNIFISINEFTKFFEVFKFNKLLKSYSCGTYNFKNKNKTSIQAYSLISQKLKYFLIDNNIKYIYFVFKSSIRINYFFLNIFLTIINDEKHPFITILNLYLKLSFPLNGCKLKKHRFL